MLRLLKLIRQNPGIKLENDRVLETGFLCCWWLPVRLGAILNLGRYRVVQPPLDYYYYIHSEYCCRKSIVHPGSLELIMWRTQITTSDMGVYNKDEKRTPTKYKIMRTDPGTADPSSHLHLIGEDLANPYLLPPDIPGKIT